MITKPTEGTFTRLVVRVNGGPNEDAMDSFPVPFTFEGFALEGLTDQDIDDMIQVVVNRIIEDHPDYTVYVTRTWSGSRTEPQQTVYAPEPEPQP
ncbi:hypothetical protein [Streptomyces sp. AS02]|uniref:hypothetical protein n=1 Tax=Streptomyces sp. AS02 TaxID=2938946 RepID=UPI00202124A1|nr:hypothetical protein [Streptomyces sp. AS02]MCL8016962.1 hypothetical protein [Streptomyces sp. AS02]